MPVAFAWSGGLHNLLGKTLARVHWLGLEH
jgi:hypothetical protein